ncbi:MAG: sugar transferase, partial [Mogibacterium sp.]|nr:sugar transferase [Mogibacterium sp.]
MNKLTKLAVGIIGADLAATSVVAVQNAVEENRETESKHHKGFYEKYVKRPTDFFLASGALVALSPVLVGTAIAVRTKLGSPVLFKQERPGKDGKIFKLYKFRTMIDPQTRDGRKLSDKERLECIEKGIDILTDEERLPKFGRILRATSIDELPELLNIFLGDMSIVGPRPLATIYLPYYSKEEMRRHDVRPGLTGWAQVQGRNAASWK